jgi:hypothetical protein
LFVQGNNKWVEEVIAQGGQPMSDPNEPRCPVCDRILGLVYLRLANKPLMPYTRCIPTCTYEVTPYEDEDYKEV